MTLKRYIPYVISMLTLFAQPIFLVDIQKNPDNFNNFAYQLRFAHRRSNKKNITQILNRYRDTLKKRGYSDKEIFLCVARLKKEVSLNNNGRELIVKIARYVVCGAAVSAVAFGVWKLLLSSNGPESELEFDCKVDDIENMQNNGCNPNSLNCSKGQRQKKTRMNEKDPQESVPADSSEKSKKNFRSYYPSNNNYSEFFICGGTCNRYQACKGDCVKQKILIKFNNALQQDDNSSCGLFAWVNMALDICNGWNNQDELKNAQETIRKWLTSGKNYGFDEMNSIVEKDSWLRKHLTVDGFQEWKTNVVKTKIPQNFLVNAENKFKPIVCFPDQRKASPKGDFVSHSVFLKEGNPLGHYVNVKLERNGNKVFMNIRDSSGEKSGNPEDYYSEFFKIKAAEILGVARCCKQFKS
ncbi:hypothetical protein KAU11_02545 [Candidatus Babeliales bacterium]|nr:hypothetical protein [Candidatus Babeliales bacterium]